MIAEDIGSENLLSNPGFEQGSYNPNKFPDFWHGSNPKGKAFYSWSKNEGRDSSRCVRPSQAEERYGLSHEPIPIDSSKSYLLSAWVRTAGLNNNEFWIRVALGGENTKTKHLIRTVPAGNEWQYVSLAVTDINTEATHVRVMVQIRGGAKGSVWVDDLFFGERERVLFRSIYPIPKLTGIRPNLSLHATDFFRVENILGVWWLVNPDGSLFWSKGINSIGCGNMFIADNFDGTLREFVEGSFERTVDWGFNTAGNWSKIGFDGSLSITEWNESRVNGGKQPIAFFVTLNCANAGYSDKEGIAKNLFLLDIEGKTQGQGQGHRFPDPFNPIWQKALGRYIPGKVLPWVEERRLIGYFVDNELSVFNLEQYIWSKYALEEFAGVLKEKYKTAAALNKV